MSETQHYNWYSRRIGLERWVKIALLLKKAFSKQ